MRPDTSWLQGCDAVDIIMELWGQVRWRDAVASEILLHAGDYVIFGRPCSSRTRPETEA